MACSLRSTRVLGRHHYCGTVRHCMPRYSTLLLTDLAAWRSPFRARLSHRPSRSQCRGRSFPRSTLAPEPGSRRLYAGCRLGSKQVPPRLVPSRSAFSVAASLEVPLDASSAVHSRSPSRLTPDALLERLFPQRSPPRPWCRRSLRQFGTSACAAVPRGLPSSPTQHCFGLSYLHRANPPHSWHNRPLDIELDVKIRSLRSICVDM